MNVLHDPNVGYMLLLGGVALAVLESPMEFTSLLSSFVQGQVEKKEG